MWEQGSSINPELKVGGIISDCSLLQRSRSRPLYRGSTSGSSSTRASFCHFFRLLPPGYLVHFTSFIALPPLPHLPRLLPILQSVLLYLVTSPRKKIEGLEIQEPNRSARDKAPKDWQALQGRSFRRRQSHPPSKLSLCSRARPTPP